MATTKATTKTTKVMELLEYLDAHPDKFRCLMLHVDRCNRVSALDRQAPSILRHGRISPMQSRFTRYLRDLRGILAAEKQKPELRKWRDLLNGLDIEIRQQIYRKWLAMKGSTPTRIIGA